MDISEWCPKLFLNKSAIEMELLKENIRVSKIYANPIWDYHSNKMAILRKEYPDQVFEIMDERENSTHKAQRIHNLFYSQINNSYHRKDELYYLYIECGLKFTQFTVLDNTGESARVIRVPIDYSPAKRQFFQEISERLYEEFFSQIDHVVTYGTIYHFAKGKVPTYVNSIHKFAFQNYGIDYSDLGFMSNKFMTIKMIIIDDLCVNRKSMEHYNFEYYNKGDCNLEFEIDLTDTGIEIFKKDNFKKCENHHPYPYPIKYYPYPHDWEYDEEGMNKILELISHYC